MPNSNSNSNSNNDLFYPPLEDEGQFAWDVNERDNSDGNEEAAPVLGGPGQLSSEESDLDRALRAIQRWNTHNFVVHANAPRTPPVSEDTIEVAVEVPVDLSHLRSSVVVEDSESAPVPVMEALAVAPLADMPARNEAWRALGTIGGDYIRERLNAPSLDGLASRAARAAGNAEAAAVGSVSPYRAAATPATRVTVPFTTLAGTPAIGYVNTQAIRRLRLDDTVPAAPPVNRYELTSENVNRNTARLSFQQLNELLGLTGSSISVTQSRPMNRLMMIDGQYVDVDPVTQPRTITEVNLRTPLNNTDYTYTRVINALRDVYGPEVRINVTGAGGLSVGGSVGVVGPRSNVETLQDLVNEQVDAETIETLRRLQESSHQNMNSPVSLDAPPGNGYSMGATSPRWNFSLQDTSANFDSPQWRIDPVTPQIAAEPADRSAAQDPNNADQYRACSLPGCRICDRQRAQNEMSKFENDLYLKKRSEDLVGSDRNEQAMQGPANMFDIITPNKKTDNTIKGYVSPNMALTQSKFVTQSRELAEFVAGVEGFPAHCVRKITKVEGDTRLTNDTEYQPIGKRGWNPVPETWYGYKANEAADKHTFRTCKLYSKIENYSLVGVHELITEETEWLIGDKWMKWAPFVGQKLVYEARGFARYPSEGAEGSGIVDDGAEDVETEGLGLDGIKEAKAGLKAKLSMKKRTKKASNKIFDSM